MKKLTKSIVAMIALFAMLTQNAYGVYAAATAPQPIEVENEYVEESSDPVIEVSSEETSEDVSSNEEGTPVEYVDGDLDVDDVEPTDDVNYDDQVMPLEEDEAISEEAIEEVIEEDENIPEELDIYDQQISGSGLDELEVYVDTEQLEVGDSFRIIFTGPDSARYDTRLNDDLDTTSQGTYRFVDLNKEGFNIRATSDDNVQFEFTFEDGTPVIRVISVESEDDKLLFTKTVEDNEGNPIAAIKGEGYKNLTININSEDLDDDAEYTIYVDTEADIQINGEYTDSLSATKSLESIELSNLNKKSFFVYIVGNEDSNVESEASVIDVSEGTAEFILKTVAVKTVYEYEDDKVYVRAVLQKADAIPDNAVLIAKAIPEEEAAKYYKAMNEDAEINADDGETTVEFNKENTLLYDISFYIDETMSEVIEPEEGSVTVSVSFKNDELKEELGATVDEEVEVTHFIEDGASIEVEKPDLDVSVEDEIVEFATDSFSTFAITIKISGNNEIEATPGAALVTKELLGKDAFKYGLVIDHWTLNTDAETSAAAKTIEMVGSQSGVTTEKAEAKCQYWLVGDVTSTKKLQIKGVKPVVITIPESVWNDKVNHDFSGISDRNGDFIKIFDDNAGSVVDTVRTLISGKVTELMKNDSIGGGKTNGIYNINSSIQPSSDGKITIDITKNKEGKANSDGTYYIDLDAFPKLKAAFANTSGVTIKKNSEQKLVFYSKNGFSISKYELVDGGKQINIDSDLICKPSKVTDRVIEDIIFASNTSDEITLNGVGGIFLFPNATVKQGNTGAGWLIAKNFDNGSGEWHFTNYDIPEFDNDSNDAEFYIDITKELYGGKWPENGFTFELAPHKFVEGDASRNIEGEASRNIDIKYNGQYEKSPMPENAVNRKVTVTITNYTTDADGKMTGHALVGPFKVSASDIYPVGKEPDANGNLIGNNGITSMDKCSYWSGRVGNHSKGEHVMNQLYMYEIREVTPEEDRDGDIVYQKEPWYVKVSADVVKHIDNANKRNRYNIFAYVDNVYREGELNINTSNEIIESAVCGNIATNPVVFKNYARPKVQLEATKTINGSSVLSVPNDKFTFNLYGYQGMKWAGKKKDGKNVSSDGFWADPIQSNVKCIDGKVTFDPINLYFDASTNAGERDITGKAFFYYKIVENDCQAPYNKDKSVYIARVMLEKNKDSKGGYTLFNGYKEPKIEYFKFDDATKVDCISIQDATKSGLLKMSFNNTCIMNKSTTIYAKKNFNKDLAGGEFGFKLYEVKTVNGVETEVLVPQAGTSDGVKTNSSNGIVTFDAINYSYPESLGTHTYKVYEVIPETANATNKYTDPATGITYDPNPKTVVVSVSCDNYASDMTITQTVGTQAKPVEFTNTYNASGKLQFKVNKSWSDDMPANTVFKFNLSKKKADGTLESLGDKTITSSATGSGNVLFNEINLEAGEFDYVIKEVANEAAGDVVETVTVGAKTFKKINGVMYDTTVYNIHVSAVDNGKGVIEAKIANALVTAPYEVSFENDYEITNTKDNITGNKKLLGADLERKAYSFVLSASDKDNNVTANAITTGDVVMPETLTVSNGADETKAIGSIVFDDITFNKVGEYEFKVAEVVPTNDADDDIVYATQPAYVQFKVENVKGQLTVTSKKVNGSATEDLEFINYTGKDSAHFEITKELKDTKGNAVPFDSNKFSFQLYKKTSSGYEAIGDVITNDGTKVTFDEQQYNFDDFTTLNGTTVKTETKSFIYKIEEIDDIDGYEFGGPLYVTVSVTASLDKANNTASIIAEAPVYSSDEAGNNRVDAKIVNKVKYYGTVEFDGTKRLDGREWKADEDNGKLYVQLYDEDGNAIDDMVAPIIGEDKSVPEFNFAPIEYYSTGTYTYILKEEGSIDNVKSVVDEFKVVVDVHEKSPQEIDANGNVVLEAVPTYYYTSGTEVDGVPQFVNQFKNGSAQIYAHKSVDYGSVLDIFQFELYEKTGEDAQGSAIWNKIQTKTNDGELVTFDSITYELKDLEDATSKNFYYQIREVEPEVDSKGMPKNNYKKKDNRVFNVTVTVSETATGLDTSVSYVDGINGQALFENEFVVNKDYTFNVYKKLVGLDMLDNQFCFELYDENGPVKDSSGSAIVKYAKAGKAGEEVKVDFPTFTLDQTDLDTEIAASRGAHKNDEGHFEKVFYIKEDVSNVPTGYTYDHSIYCVKLEYWYDADAKEIKYELNKYLTGLQPTEAKWYEKIWSAVVEFITGEDPLTKIVFENSYQANAKLQLSAHKNVKGAEITDFEEGTFKFTISGKDENGKSINETVPCDTTTGVALFSPIEYKKAGNYEYKITEEVTNKAGVSYDTTEYVVNVAVTDNRSGILQVSTAITPSASNADASYSRSTANDAVMVNGVCTPDAVEFVNTYRPLDGEITIGGTKDISGTDIANYPEMFSFTMKSIEKDGYDYKEYSSTVNNGKNGKEGLFSFDKLTFTYDDLYDSETKTYLTSKDYAYQIDEVDGNLENVTYVHMPSEVYARVSCEDASGNRLATLAVTLYTIDSEGNELVITSDDYNAVVGYTNIYNREGSTTVQAIKKVSGTAYKGDEFTFSLTGDGITDSVDKTVVAGGTATFTLPSANETYQLSDIMQPAYKTDNGYERTYTYTLTEVEEEDGYDYSQEEYTIEVTVSTDGKGSFNIDKTITNKAGDEVSIATPVEFENTFHAKGIATINGLKEYIGASDISRGEFTFKLLEKTDSEDIEDWKVVATVTNGNKYSADGSVVALDDIYDFVIEKEFDEKAMGDHSYVLVEVEGDDAKVSYDDTVYDVVINVADNGNTNDEGVRILDCTTTITGCTIAKFTNTEITPDSVLFKATKKYNDGLAIPSGVFSFTLKEVNKKGNHTAVNETKTLTAGNEVSFTAIPYTKDMLIYDKASGTYKNTFTYEISENDCGKKWITQKTNKYTAIVEVELNKSTGKIEIKKNEIKDSSNTKVGENGDCSNVIFENENTSEDSVDFYGKKILTGFEKRDPAYKGTYSFILENADGEEIARREVTGEGEFAFLSKDVKELNYTMADYVKSTTYSYKVYESVEDPQTNVEYALNSYDIVVNLTLDKDQKLVATPVADVTVNDKKNPGLCFENSYTNDGTVFIYGTKTITGTNLSNEFIFDLYEEINGEVSEKPIAYTTNVGSSFKFSIEYGADDIGTHTYYVQERTGDNPKIEYDSVVYKVVVLVSDNSESLNAENHGDGKLITTKTYYKKNVDENKQVTWVKLDVEKPDTYELPFKNTYTASGNETIDGLKVLSGRDIIAEEFQFALYDENGAESSLITTKACDADGKFSFDFEYDEEDLKVGDSYQESVTKYYTIREIKNGKGGISYSGALYGVEMVLTDNKTGTILVDKSIKEISKDVTDKSAVKLLVDNLKDKIHGNTSDVKFTNAYSVECNWDPQVMKFLNGKKLDEDGIFEFKFEELEVVDGKATDKVIKGHTATAHNGGANHDKVVFDDKNVDFLTYKVEGDRDDTGLHVYRMTEVDPGENKREPGVEYSEEIAIFHVNVEDDGLGNIEATCAEESTKGDVSFTFENKYKADGAIDLVGRKSFNGPDKIAEGFKFSIQETTSGRESSVYEATNDNGIVRFTSDLPILQYKYDPSNDINDIGVHTYVIKEIVPEVKAPGVTYNPEKKEYTVTVDVKDAGDGTLTTYVTSKYALNGGVASDSYGATDKSADGKIEANYFAFNNTYEAKAELLLKGVKHVKQYEDSAEYMSGTDLAKALDKAGFTFNLYKVDNKGRHLVDFTKPDSTGRYTLGADDNGESIVKFTQDNIGETLHYQIEEVKKVDDGVKYDETVYDIYVTVEPAAENSDKLKLTVTGANGAAISTENRGYIYTASSFDFTNYMPEYVTVSGVKHWMGGPAEGGLDTREITVNLYASNVGVGTTVINSAKVNASTNYRYSFSTYANGKPLPAYTTTGTLIEYRVEEVFDDPDYVKDTEKIDDYTYDFYNTYGKLFIRKIDAVTKAPLAGAELVILDASGNEVDRWVSGVSAHSVDPTKVKVGATYTLHEVSAPTGYKLAEDKTFVFESGKTVTVEMEDERIIGSVRLRKLDATTREALEGAEFALYREDGTRIYASGVAGAYRYSETSSNGRFAVDARGELEISNLPYGSYYFVEVAAPTGYVLSTERTAFSVLTDGSVAEVTVLNTKEVGSVRLRKTNADGSVSLPGAVFELYAKTPTTVSSAIASTIYSDVYYLVGTYTTDASGMIEVGNLPWDDYYFVEVQAPEGYEVNTDVNGDPIAYTFRLGTTGTALISYDLGRITNEIIPTTPPTPPELPRRGGEVRGERRPTDSGRRTGGVLSGVLGVRAAPKAGVLGERLGPVTGDAFNIFLWTLLLLASIGAIVAVAFANAKRKRQAR